MLFKEFKEQIPFWVDEYIKDHPQKSIESAIKNKKYIVKTGAKSLYDDQIKFETNPIEIKNPYIKGNDNLIDLSEEDEEKALQDLMILCHLKCHCIAPISQLFFRLRHFLLL